MITVLKTLYSPSKVHSTQPWKEIWSTQLNVMQGVDSMILIAVDEKLQIIESKIVHFILGIGVIASSSF